MGLIGLLLLFGIGITFAGGAAYLVWRLLDHGDADALRAHVEVLERRLAALEAERAGTDANQ